MQSNIYKIYTRIKLNKIKTKCNIIRLYILDKICLIYCFFLSGYVTIYLIDIVTNNGDKNENKRYK